jgi:hypothetical protein
MFDRTNFPNGITDKAQSRVAGRTEVTGKATIATGLATVVGAIASLEVLSATAKHGYGVSAVASATVGSIDVVVRDTVGAEATTAVFVDWLAFGT